MRIKLIADVFSQVVKNVLVFFLTFIGIIFVIVIIFYGGLNYFDSKHPEGFIEYIFNKILK